jgi:hypothetical protein
MGEPDATGIFHASAEVPVQRLAQRAVAGHVDIGNVLIRGQRGYSVIGDDLVIAAERFDEGDIRGRSQPDDLDALRACRRCASPNAVLLEADESSTLLAPKNSFSPRKSSTMNDSINSGRNKA